MPCRWPVQWLSSAVDRWPVQQLGSASKLPADADDVCRLVCPAAGLGQQSET